mmetsp:Transcript_253/g.381  ORF Transcript_253/g.381 Transcript_253/m.381 type:complete len:113 (-) Transcript_253:550-888(-)
MKSVGFGVKLLPGNDLHSNHLKYILRIKLLILTSLYLLQQKKTSSAKKTMDEKRQQKKHDKEIKRRTGTKSGIYFLSLCGVGRKRDGLMLPEAALKVLVSMIKRHGGFSIQS